MTEEPARRDGAIGQDRLLASAGVGSSVRVVAVDGDRALRHRALSLGLRPGATLIVVHRRSGGVVVACGGGRVALGPEVAAHIVVTASVSPREEAL